MSTATKKITIVGAREHNLKGISVVIPKDALTVITGPSGSGKSSLALETLFAEGQRRYIESLSSYARQSLGIGKKPDVEKIEGLCPAIAIDQKSVGFNPRSTVGTVTEVYDYLRVFFANIGQPSCFKCGLELKQGSIEEVAKLLATDFAQKKVWVASALSLGRKGEFKQQLKDYFQKGCRDFLIDGMMHSFSSVLQVQTVDIKKADRHYIFALWDKLVPGKEDEARLLEVVKLGFDQGAPGAVCAVLDTDFKVQAKYSCERICLDCAVTFPALEPRLFSFNSPAGACTSCSGLGVSWQLSVQDLTNFDGDLPSMQCSTCDGARLNKHALAVRVAGKNIFDVSCLPIERSLEFLELLTLTAFEKRVTERLLLEIKARLGFLLNVGLGYLSLARSSTTLSGGESQRIRLATQLGSALTGVLYILDEPSIGLHQRDNDKLIATLQRLRDVGNTVVVVEHDMDTMLACDYIIDMGPGAGVHGGQVVIAGSKEEVIAHPKSVTGDFLAGRREISIPAKTRQVSRWLEMKDATLHNLKNVTVKIPLGVLACITGVSGSGKSSLIVQTLVPALQNYFAKGFAVALGLEALVGAEALQNMVCVDQKPIGKTPRSNPATYLGVFNDIRNLFASLPESKIRGLGPGHFSFNVPDGRCKKCHGDGTLRIAMQFLEDVVLPCEKCKGLRYSDEVLAIKFQDKNIAQVLNMETHEAYIFFAAFAGIAKRLKLMCDVGLDYITLGQGCNTISGGEAQRIKLVTELAKRGKSTLYVLDEPTTGLHFQDVEKLLLTLNKLVENGNSVIIIEHNLDVIKSCDYLIDMGPEGGDRGGHVVFAGTPRALARHGQGWTAQYLQKFF